jgi:hypothetical protein
MEVFALNLRSHRYKGIGPLWRDNDSREFAQMLEEGARLCVKLAESAYLGYLILR